MTYLNLSRLRRIPPALLLALGITAPLMAASPVEALFQKALVKESVERDLDGAVALYQQVIDQAPADPAVAGEARLRMGICYERLGKPLEAERAYRQILAGSTGISPEVAQQARTNLRRLEAEGRLVVGSSTTARSVLVRRFQATRFSLLVGPSLFTSNNGLPVIGLSPGLRFRTSASGRPLSWFLEARGTAPLSDSNVGNQAEVFDSQGTDSASLAFKYQASLGLVGELPHGDQRIALPEVGAGLALTAAKITYTSAASSGERTQKTWSPYLQAGVHLFPDRIVSVLFQANYVAAPYPKSVDIPAPAHSQSFNFPSSLWTLGAALQIKIGRFVRVPQR